MFISLFLVFPGSFFFGHSFSERNCALYLNQSLSVAITLNDN